MTNGGISDNFGLDSRWSPLEDVAEENVVLQGGGVGFSLYVVSWYGSVNLFNKQSHTPEFTLFEI